MTNCIPFFFKQVNPCKASVIERANGVYQIGSNAHNHPAEVGAALAASITAKGQDQSGCRHLPTSVRHR